MITAICVCAQECCREAKVDSSLIKGFGICATCSLAVFTEDNYGLACVTGPYFKDDGNDRNVILWLDHRAGEETETINATRHNLLRYTGGSMSIEMEGILLTLFKTLADTHSAKDSLAQESYAQEVVFQV
jgi:nuclear pore complex protein Nup93